MMKEHISRMLENDAYSKLTFPFNKSQDGYGVIIIPSKQVMMSNCHNYEGDVMYDIDIGSKRGRLKVRCKDKDGSMREDMMLYGCFFAIFK